MRKKHSTLGTRMWIRSPRCQISVSRYRDDKLLHYVDSKAECKYSIMVRTKGRKHIQPPASAQILMMSVPAHCWYFINSWHVRTLNISSLPWPWDVPLCPKCQWVILSDINRKNPFQLLICIHLLRSLDLHRSPVHLLPFMQYFSIHIVMKHKYDTTSSV